MALSSRATPDYHYQPPRKCKERQTYSPERNRVWIEPKPDKTLLPHTNKKVPVVYYISRNGQLDHPHFLEVSLSSNDGLYLRDVINRLNVLRGKGMATLYSWSSKRSYKNGYVWHDLSDGDFIHPVHGGHEYVLKGSEILDPSGININPSSITKTTSFRYAEIKSTDSPGVSRRRNQSWSSIDLNEYKVYKTDSFSDSTRQLAADASTQTDDLRRRRKPTRTKEESSPETYYPSTTTTELSRAEISPPPLDSSPETLESLMKSDGRLILCGAPKDEGLTTPDKFASGRMKASTVLMQLISCGSVSFKDCGVSLVKDQGVSLVKDYKCSLSRGIGNKNSAKKVVGTENEVSRFSGLKLEEKEYFSGSLIETRKELVPSLKRSSSYNADSSVKIKGKKMGDESDIKISRKSNKEGNKNDQSGSKRHEV